MLYIIIVIVILLLSIICAVWSYLQKEDGFLFYPLMSGMLLLFVIGGLWFYGETHADDYLASKYDANPVVTQAIEELPFETHNTAANVYIVKGQDSQNNPRYHYCVKTEDGYQEKFADGLDVSFEYIPAGEQPHLKYYSDTRYEVLSKKPSFWLNIFGWLEYKDYENGDTYDTWGAGYNGKYVFYVPKGTMREKE